MTDVIQWSYVIKRFSAFLGNLSLTENQILDGRTKFRGVVSCLNNAYYGSQSESDHAFLIGSWAKETKIRPPRDVDLYFILPNEVYYRFENYSGNKQSALLQEVKNKILSTYSNSNIKGDGPVVLAGFYTYDVEIVPAFALQEDRAYYVCDTKQNGSYKKTTPLHEVDAVNSADLRNAKNVRPLIRMLKSWQNYCSVPLKSFYLELICIEYMDQCAWKLNGLYYYDWICRDFFSFLIGKAGSFVITPGTYQVIWLGDNWKSKAESAFARSTKACDYERDNKMTEAGDEWQKVFGGDIPRSV